MYNKVVFHRNRYIYFIRIYEKPEELYRIIAWPVMFKLNVYKYYIID